MVHYSTLLGISSLPQSLDKITGVGTDGNTSSD